MNVLLNFQDCKNNNSRLLQWQHAALHYMTLMKLFEYIRKKCENYQHLQVRGRDLRSTKFYGAVIDRNKAANTK